MLHPTSPSLPPEPLRQAGDASPHVASLNPSIAAAPRKRHQLSKPAEPSFAAASPPRSLAAPKDPGFTTAARGRAALADPVPTAQDPPA